MTPVGSCRVFRSDVVMADALLWTKKLPGTFYGATAAVGPDWLALMVLEDATPGVVGYDHEGEVQWRLSPATRFEADHELLWFGGSRNLRLVRALDGSLSAYRDFPEGVSVVSRGVVLVGTHVQGKLIGVDTSLKTQWEWSERPGDWSITPRYLCSVHAGHSHVVSLPRLERKEIRVSVSGSPSLAFEHQDVIAHVPLSEGEGCGVSLEQGKEIWRRMIEPRGHAMKWGDSFILCSERLERVDIATGKTVWTRPLDSRASHPVVVGDEIYFTTKSARIQVVSCTTGEMTFDAPPFFETERSGWPYAVLPCGPDKLFVVMNTELHCVSR